MHRCLDIAGYQMGYQMGYLFSDWNHWWLNRLQEYNRVQFPGDSACLGTLLSSRPVSQTQHLFPMATKWPPDGHQIMATSGTGGAKLPPKKNPQWPPAAENGVVHVVFVGGVWMNLSHGFSHGRWTGGGNWIFNLSATALKNWVWSNDWVCTWSQA